MREIEQSLWFRESETPVGLRPPSVSDSRKLFCVGRNTLKKRKKLFKKRVHFLLWEVEHGQECAHTHNIKRIYNELNKKTKRDIETMYQEKTDVFKKMSGNRAGKKIKLGEIVDLASWEQALESNEITMKNFKYDHYCPDVLS